MDTLAQHIAALVFASPQPVPLAELVAVLREALQQPVEETAVSSALERVHVQYQEAQFPFELVEIAGGYQFMTKGAYHATIAIHLKQTTKKRLSQAALETLSIVAYKQPISKSELEEIRGVSCDYALQKLLEKELVSISGRSEGPGRPLLYSTTPRFMDYFGIKSLDEMPKLKDFKDADSTIGTPEQADSVGQAATN